MLPVPIRRTLSPPPTSNPCSTSLGGDATGKRGKVRRVIKEGKTLSRSMNSGLGRSGEVHIRRNSSSASSNADEFCELSALYAAFGGGGGSSVVGVEIKAEAFDDGEDEREPDNAGVSKKGSLGARARFVCAVLLEGLDIGCDWDRVWMVDGAS